MPPPPRRRRTSRPVPIPLERRRDRIDAFTARVRALLRRPQHRSGRT